MDKVKESENYTKIKLELLKSGLPLESTVAELLNDLSQRMNKPLTNHGEFYFKRQESTLPSSIDFLLTYDLDINGYDFVQIVFLIECKYRTQGTTWFFAGNPGNEAGMECFLEDHTRDVRGIRYKFPKFFPPLGDERIPIGRRAIEIYGNGDRNEKSINEALHQLMFATCSLFTRPFIKTELLSDIYLKNGINLKGRSFHSLLCPVVITTARLNYLRANLDRVEESERLRDVSTVEDMIVYAISKTPPHLENYVQTMVFDEIKHFLPKNKNEQWLRSILQEYVMLSPSRFYFINYKDTQPFIKRYIETATEWVKNSCKI